MSFYVSTAIYFLLHCDKWDRFVAPPRNKFVTGATLLQLVITLASKQEFRVLLLELLYMDTFCGFRANNFMMLFLIRERPFNLKGGGGGGLWFFSKKIF